jgi:hypothetical protein
MPTKSLLNATASPLLSNNDKVLDDSVLRKFKYIVDRLENDNTCFFQIVSTSPISKTLMSLTNVSFKPDFLYSKLSIIKLNNEISLSNSDISS